MTNAQEPVGPDPLADPGRPSSSGSEDLDEDALDADPLEEAMDPPEHWSAVIESRRDDLDNDGGALEDRLAEEEPEVAPEGTAAPDQERREEF